MPYGFQESALYRGKKFVLFLALSGSSAIINATVPICSRPYKPREYTVSPWSFLKLRRHYEKKIFV